MNLLLLILFLTMAICSNAQEISPITVSPLIKSASEKSENANDIVEKKELEKEKILLDETDKTSQQTNQTQPYVRPNTKTRLKRYLGNTIGPSAFIGSAFGAGIDTLSNAPPEWGKTGKGFGRRFASEFGKNIIQETTTYALDEAFKLDSAYYRSTKKGFAPRLQHAVVSSFTSRNKNGKQVFGFSRVAGIYASELIAKEAWYPDRFSVKDGLRDGTISIGTNVIFNVIREFIFK